MRPLEIEEKENEFYNSLVNKQNKTYTLTGTENIWKDVNVYSIKPKHSSYYYAEVTTKKSICMHFTIGYILSDVNALTKVDNHVSVSYVVDRGGRIYELFNDKYWSYHLGQGTIGGNSNMSKQSIGIEISNYGPLKNVKGNMIDAYGGTYCTEDDFAFYEEIPFRENLYFASMTERQINSTAALLNHLSKKHGIALNFKMDEKVFASDAEARAYSGIFTHANVRKDKSDWPMSDSYKVLIERIQDL